MPFTLLLGITNCWVLSAFKAALFPIPLTEILPRSGVGGIVPGQETTSEEMSDVHGPSKSQFIRKFPVAPEFKRMSQGTEQ